MNNENLKIIIVDDEEMVLSGYRRLMMEHFKLTTFHDPMEAAKYLKENPDVAVVVSDFRMPKVDGVKLLGFAKKYVPDAIRIMLSGNADQEVAINAINDGSIFKFLTKPCPNTLFIKTIYEALELHKLKKNEKEIIEKTLQGAIKILIEVLSITSPIAFSMTQQSRMIAKKIISRLSISDGWEFELATMLSYIGLVTIPKEIVEKFFKFEEMDNNEYSIFKNFPKSSSKFISNIPKLENIAKAVALQLLDFEKLKTEIKNKKIQQMASMVRLVNDFSRLNKQFEKEEDVLNILKERRNVYDETLFAALAAEIMNINKDYIVKVIKVEQLKVGMILADDLRDNLFTLILPKGSIVTEIVQNKILNSLKFGRSFDDVKIIEKIS